MSLLIAIVGAVFAIFIIILLHEMGHYFVAKAFGIKIVRFSIGFGKAIYKWKNKAGTEFLIALFPIGGYVKMFGENEQEIKPESVDQAFNHKPLLIRMAVVLAGPVINILLAIIVYWGVFLNGMVHIKPIIGQVKSTSIAAKAGLREGDEIVKVNGKSTISWHQVLMSLMMRMGDRDSLIMVVKSPNSSKLKKKELQLVNWQVDSNKPNFLGSLGIKPYQPKILPMVDRIISNSPASKSPLQSGDQLLSINGKKVSSWQQAVNMIHKLPGRRVIMTVKRGQSTHTFNILIGSKVVQSRQQGYLGVMVKMPLWPKKMLIKEQYSVFTAWMPAFSQIWYLFKLNVFVLSKLIVGKLSIHALGGPISVFHAAGKASQAGLIVYLSFIGFISLTVAFINLLPIPGLDGGHLFFYIIEGIFRHPVPDRYQMIGLSLGMVFLILLMVQVTINDLLRFFN